MLTHRSSGPLLRLVFAVSAGVVGLCLLAAAIRLPVAAAASSVLPPPVSITLTAAGPDPASISVPVGTSVIWLNAAGKPIYLSSEASRLFLPLLLHAGTTAHAATPAASPSPAGGPWISVVLPAGETYTHTFDLPGDFPYMAVGTIGLWGHVNVYAVPDFELGVLPPEQTLVRGETAHFQVALTPTWGFTAPVTLAVLDLPEGVSAAAAVNPLAPPGSTDLALTVRPTSTVGSHPLRVVGIGAGQAHTVPITLALTSYLPNLAWLELDAVPGDGDVLDVAATIRNTGQGWVDRPFDVAWRLEPAWQPGLPAAITGTFSLPYLAAETSVRLSVTVPFSRPGSYNLYGILDPAAAITETDEGDNSISAFAAVPGRVEICGDLVGQAVWDGGPYVLTCDVTIPAGSSLDIHPGVVVKPMYGSVRLIVDGVLNTQGVPGQPVILTSYYDDAAGGDTDGDGGATSPAPGHWGQVWLRPGGRAALAETIVRYAGWGNWPAVQHEGAALDLTGGAVITNTQYGIYSLNSGGLSLEGTSISGHGYGIWLEGSTSGPVTIARSEFNANSAAGIQFNGPIAATQVLSSTFAGNGSALGIGGQASDILVQGNHITDSSGPAVRMQDLAGGGPRFVGNTAAGNARNGVELTGAVTGAGRLTRSDPELAYYIDQATFTVEAGASLDVEAGTVLKLWWTSYSPGGRLLALPGSRLSMLGTPSRPITVTSLADDSAGGDTNNDAGATLPGTPNWLNVALEGDAEAELAYTSLRYGGVTGGGWSYAEYPLLYAPGPGAAVTLTHVLVGNAVNTGAQFSSPASLRVADSTFMDNRYHGVYLDGAFGAPPQITGSHFVSNTHAERQPAGLFVANPIVGLTVTDSEFRGNNAALVLNGLSGPGPVFSGNSFSGNDRNGIRLQGSALGASTLRRPEPLVAYYIDQATFTVEAGASLDVEAGTVLKLWWTSYSPGGRLLALPGSRLSMLGTPSRPITVTSLADDSAGGDTNNDGGSTLPGTPNWLNIALEGDAEAELAYTSLRYGGVTGGGWSYAEYPLLYAPGPGAAVTLTHVLVGNAVNTGAQFSSPATLHIADSTFMQNREGLVVAGAAAPAILDSAFLNNSANGLRLQGVVTGTIISACTVSGNPTGILTEQDARAVIVGCSIQGNPTWGLYNDSAGVTIDAAGNWWGSDTGPYHATGNPAGLGDRISGNASFTPWLMAAP